MSKSNKNQVSFQETVAENNTTVKNGSCSRCNCSGVVILFIIIATLIILWVIYYFIPNQVALQVEQKIMDIEYAKVWGKDNYNIVNKVQLQQIESFISQYKQQWWDVNNTNTQTDNTQETLTKDEIAAIKDKAYIEWNKESKITLVEYSDLECPFCIRQYRNWVIKKLHEKYWDQLNSIFKNYRWVPHKNSEAEANATLCVWELWWAEKYISYYSKIFERTTESQDGSGFSQDNLVPLAKEIWINESDFKACVDSNKNIAKFDADTEEWQKLWVRGTPWTVIINNETWKYIVIWWAYPIENFEKAIDELLK